MKWVFSLDLKERRDLADLTSWSSLFQTYYGCAFVYLDAEQFGLKAISPIWMQSKCRGSRIALTFKITFCATDRRNLSKDPAAKDPVATASKPWQAYVAVDKRLYNIVQIKGYE